MDLFSLGRRVNARRFRYTVLIGEDMSYSDEELDKAISSSILFTESLQELKLSRKQHKPVKFETVKFKTRLFGRVNSVTCACGKVTNYKVPLISIDEFKCPKDEI